MHSHESGARPAARRAPIVILAILVLALIGPLALAAGVGTTLRKASPVAMKTALQAKDVMPPGADVDGDGAPDFVNPTGKPLRADDAFGSGVFLASRDGGVRRHLGADYVAVAGQAVAAPISGYVTKIGFAYAGDQQLRYVELTNRAIGYAVRVFYLQPVVMLGEAVRLGQTLGRAESLQGRYPGITDHVHVEVAELARGHVDPAKLIPSPESYL